MSVPVIDLFAGPGGLGEGFFRSRTLDFEIAVSIEKDEMAYETLLLRAAHRAVMRTGMATREVWAAWDRFIADSSWEDAFDSIERSGIELFASACAKARTEAWNLELGEDNQCVAMQGIRKRLKPFMRDGMLPNNAVLIGGPPCQAYSVVGRSRNRGNQDYVAEEDHRNFLYKEYLQAIREFRPAVFVMENVKGILTSRVADGHIFQSIMSDLQRPDLACGDDTGLHYTLTTLNPGSGDLADSEDPRSFVIHAEDHGIPQARHRVIICGMRRDVMQRADGIGKLRLGASPTVSEVIKDLPRLRPQLSSRGCGAAWPAGLDHPLLSQALEQLEAQGMASTRVARQMRAARRVMRREPDPGTGGTRLHLADAEHSRPAILAGWYRDRPIKALANHESRAHMPEDLVRYLFVSSYGLEIGQSPTLAHFPRALLPMHSNVDPDNPTASIFKDRFRVQLGTRHSSTVTSHIAKDGHAFIHPDPAQCRSLTVREAARLQTFPDSYVFLGNRTSQYTQVGNAVPPLLARQIADLVGSVLVRAGLAGSASPPEVAKAIRPTALPA
jgi:DNA (cytosine-5)-methyltransferase 1